MLLIPPSPLTSGNFYPWYFYYLHSFAISRMSYSWNHTVCSFSYWLLSFTNMHLSFLKREWCQQDDGIGRGPSFISPLNNNHLAAIHKRNVPLWEFWDLERRLWNSVKSKTKEGPLRGQTCAQLGGPSYRPGNSSIPLWTKLQSHLALVLPPATYAKGSRRSHAYPCLRQ